MLFSPQGVFAWAAIKSTTIATGDLLTHQMILELAYEKLSQDPAFKDNPEIFPPITTTLWSSELINMIISP